MHLVCLQSMHVPVDIIIFFVQSNDPSMLYDRLMDTFRTHSSTRFITGELTQHLLTIAKLET